jgi:S-DNA-T family DNA segregation ATPase FtsK/SpoIIIE
VLQAATLHSPRDLVIAAALDGTEGWDWLKWLPHAWARQAPRAASLGADRPSAREVVQSVLRIRAERRAEAQTLLSTSDAVFTPFVLLVIDEHAAPERPLVAELLEDAARYGIGVLWLGGGRRTLPGGCGAVIELDDRSGTLTYRDSRTVGDVLVDGTEPELASEWALALAPLRDVTVTAAGVGIPTESGSSSCSRRT